MSVLPSVLLVGMGRMGGAMAKGWGERGLSPSFAVEPAGGVAAGAETLAVVTDPDRLPAGFAPAAVVLAIKPQQATAALSRYARFAGGAVFVSIMAGRTIASVRDALGGDASIVRAMPNTPAAIRQGITVACAGPDVTDEQRRLAGALLAAVGEVAWIDDEALLDPVTAVSGGGPAYVFLLAELMERAAIEQGIPAELARRLARSTVAGSGALLAASVEDAADLRRAVTSPAGTTERALAVLMADGGWPALMSRAIAAASQRSRELAD